MGRGRGGGRGRGREGERERERERGRFESIISVAFIRIFRCIFNRRAGGYVVSKEDEFFFLEAGGSVLFRSAGGRMSFYIKFEMFALRWGSI